MNWKFVNIGLKTKIIFKERSKSILCKHTSLVFFAFPFFLVSGQKSHKPDNSPSGSNCSHGDTCNKGEYKKVIRKKIIKRTRSIRVNIINEAKSYNYNLSHCFLSVLGGTRNNP